MKLKGYTDGACFPNPGNGGWSWVITENGKLIDQASGSEENTTNNRMEYLAMIKLLEAVGHMLSVARTDSQLLVNTCMVWRHSWKRNGWMKKKTQPVKNLDLVIRISDLLDKYPVQVEWVRGHNGDEFNEVVDGLANNAAYVFYDVHDHKPLV